MESIHKPGDKHYRLVHADSAAGLQHKVNQLIEQGFIPLGRAFLIAREDSGLTGADYYQTLVHQDVGAPKS